MMPMSGSTSAVDAQGGSAKSCVIQDGSNSKEIAREKSGVAASSVTVDDSTSTPKMFNQVLSDTICPKTNATTTAAKSKAASTDSKDTTKPDETASPDIGLLMSLLPALPSTTPAAMALDTAPPVESRSDANTALLASASRVPITVAGNAQASQAQAATALKPDAGINAVTESPIVIADVAPDTSFMFVGKAADKANQFASMLTDLQPTAPTTLFAGPAWQSSTATTVVAAPLPTANATLIDLPITHSEWPTTLGHSLIWAVGEGMQKVEISVSPQDMGPINVHIRIENDKTDVRFTAMHAVTRDALEASIPRLRDLFSQQGLNLSQAQVFSQTPNGEKGRQPEHPQPQQAPLSGDATDTQQPATTRPMHWRRGLVDDYA